MQCKVIILTLNQYGGEGETIQDVVSSDAPATPQHMKNNVVGYM
jgi:hypothetical protein